jgi:aminoglycoside phosphotransferase (APT) family kinase protein
MASDELAAQLQQAFPDLKVSPLRLLDVGFGSTVVETADGVVLRIARHARAAKGHAREARLLPQLQGRLPAAIPDPCWRSEPGELFSFGVIGYRKLPGKPLAPADANETIAADIAAFIEQLHDVADVDAPSYLTDPVRELHDTTTDVLRRMLSPDELDRLMSWWDDLRADERFGRFQPRLRHGDLWYENLLVTEGRLVGVIDWGTAEFGDPAEDFDTLRHIGDDFAEAVLAAYPHADSDLRHRIQRHWELREFWGIFLALELGDEDELHDAVRKLRAGPVLAGE